MTMTDLEALGADTEAHGPECACGCGEYLPVGSTRQFKRGHRPIDGDPPGDKPQRGTKLSIDEAALFTENDPEPPDQEPREAPIRITKRIRDDIEGKLAMMYGFIAIAWSTKDPICAQALQDNAEAIVPKIVPLICKSPELVKWFTKGGGYMAWFELMMVCWPVIQVMISHHLTHSIGGESQNGRASNPTVTYDQYQA